MNTSSSIIPGDDCDPESLSVEEALQRIVNLVRPVVETELVALEQAAGRVLAQDLVAPLQVPGADNSAMDGYALAATAIEAGSRTGLHLVGQAFAGKPFLSGLEAGQCIRIMTGALVPEGADTVVMQEQVESRDGRILIPATTRPGQHVRKAGEDIQAGCRILRAGRLLEPADIGLAASVGLARLQVQRKLRVACFTTGDELRDPGEALQPGQIHNSNRYVLQAMLGQPGIEAVDLGNVPDRPDALREIFQTAMAGRDLILSCGGVSVGEADFVREVFAELGRIRFWKVAMKPGRPLAFGQLGQAYYFGLPGNPVSAMVTFMQFVRPALQKLAGEEARAPLQLRARLLTPISKSKGRREFQRGVMSSDAAGELMVRVTGAQGSGILSSMSQANCFIVLAEDCIRVEENQFVVVQPFRAF